MKAPVLEGVEVALAWLQARAEVLKMDVTEVPLADVPGWTFDFRRIVNAMGRFYEIVGVVVRANTGREVREWGQHLFNHTSGPGNVVLAVASWDGRDWVLLRAMAEPGSKGAVLADGTDSHVLFTPTAQISASNLEKHGADAVPFAMLATTAGVRWQRPQEDPGRFRNKVNNIGLLYCMRETAEAQIDRFADNTGDFVWLPLNVVEELGQRSMITDFVLKCLAHYAFAIARGEFKVTGPRMFGRP